MGGLSTNLSGRHRPAPGHTGRTRESCWGPLVVIRRAGMRHLGPYDEMTRCREGYSGFSHPGGDYMVKTGALENEEHVTLFNQWGVPECKDRGVITQDTDCLMNVAFPYRSQVAEAREETPRMERRLPYQGSGRADHWLLSPNRHKRRQKLHVCEGARGGRLGGGPGGRVAFPRPPEGRMGALGHRNGPEEAFIDDKDSLRGTNNMRALGRGRHIE